MGFFRKLVNMWPLTGWELRVTVWKLIAGQLDVERNDKLRFVGNATKGVYVFKSNDSEVELTDYQEEQHGSRLDLLHTADGVYHIMSKVADAKTKEIVFSAGSENLMGHLHAEQAEENANRFQNQQSLIMQLAPYIVLAVVGLGIVMELWARGNIEKDVSSGVVAAAQMCSEMIKTCQVSVTPP